MDGTFRKPKEVKGVKVPKEKVKEKAKGTVLLTSLGEESPWTMFVVKGDPVFRHTDGRQTFKMPSGHHLSAPNSEDEDEDDGNSDDASSGNGDSDGDDDAAASDEDEDAGVGAGAGTLGEDMPGDDAGDEDMPADDAAAGTQLLGPDGSPSIWIMYKSDEGQPYYSNGNSTTWEMPAKHTLPVAAPAPAPAPAPDAAAAKWMGKTAMKWTGKGSAAAATRIAIAMGKGGKGGKGSAAAAVEGKTMRIAMGKGGKGGKGGKADTRHYVIKLWRSSFDPNIASNNRGNAVCNPKKICACSMIPEEMRPDGRCAQFYDFFPDPEDDSDVDKWGPSKSGKFRVYTGGIAIEAHEAEGARTSYNIPYCTSGGNTLRLQNLEGACGGADDPRRTTHEIFLAVRHADNVLDADDDVDMLDVERIFVPIGEATAAAFRKPRSSPPKKDGGGSGGGGGGGAAKRRRMTGDDAAATATATAAAAANNYNADQFFAKLAGMDKDIAEIERASEIAKVEAYLKKLKKRDGGHEGNGGNGGNGGDESDESDL